ncbi:MAG TPA: hypothetical protein PK308_11295, partial [Phycisphaerales bacterium]|nr:hypothetical protein [Phycisphaerales bacterium]
AGTSELVGLGTLPKSLRFHIKVVPTGDVLQALLGEQAYTALVAEGERGVTDSGGQPLAFPLSLISQMSPTVDYSFSFLSAGDASLQDFGAVVERFKGQPQTGFDLDNNAGVSYRDIPTSICGPKGNIFGPFIADVNLFSNGFLSGAPVQFFQKVHDDVNPPIDGQFSPFPFGTSTPIGGNSVLGGARFQHLYRAVDCSPDTVNLAGTKLHLKQLAYCPIGGTVVNTILKDVTIHAGHTTFIPDTAQNCGIPSGSATGLKDAMGGHHIPLGDTSSATYIPGNYDGVDASSQILPRQLCFGSETTPGIPDFYTGKQFKIDVNNLFIPSGSTRKYHPLPNSEFDFQFPYDNGFRDPAKARAHSLLLEYRITANPVGTQPSTANGFTFAVGILSSALPRFRVYSIGSGCVACCTDTSSAGNCTATCFNSFSPVLNPPLDPDAVITAAGPDPAPPGLDCYCLRVPTAQTPPPPGCTDQTTATPTIFDVATGAQPNPNSGNKHNNYGDNSRYYMVFNYVKKESTIRSPFVRVQPDLGGTQVVTWLAPIFHPSLAELPV